MSAGVDTARGASVVTPSALRSELRARRRAHSDRTLADALEQLYVWLFTALTLGGMAGAVVVRVWSELARCEAAGCVDARDVLPLPLGVTLVAVAVRTLVALGPVVASPAAGTFLVGTPVDRRRLLAGPATGLLAGGVLGGAGLAAVVVLLTSSAPGTLGAGAAAGAVLGLALVAAAVLAQPLPAFRRALAIGSDVLVAVAITVVALTVVVAVGADVGPDAVVPSSAWADPTALRAAAALGLVPAAALVALAFHRLGRLPRRELVAGGELLTGLAGAAASMDTSLVSDLLTARRFRRLGGARSRPGLGTGPVAIAVREATRMVRSPQRLVLAAGLLVVPYALDLIAVPSAAPLVAATVGYLALRPTTAGLHTVARSAGLRRGFPMSDLALRLSFMTPALLATAVWSAAAAPAVAGGGTALFGAGPASATSWPTAAAALAAGIAAGLVRSATRKPVSFDGPLISTPAGALPAGFVAQLFRGPDFLVIGALPLTFGLPWPLTLGVPLALLAFALGRG